MTARGVRDCGLIQGRSNAVGAPGNSQSLANDSSWLFGVERAVVSPATISQSENAGDTVFVHPAYQIRFPVQLSPCRDHRLRRFAVRVGNRPSGSEAPI